MENEMIYTGPELPIKYVKGAGPDFVVFIQALKDKAQLKVIGGKYRWVVTEEDGSQVIYRPEIHE